MNDTPCVQLSVTIACIPNEDQVFVFKYGEVAIDESRSAIRIIDTHDTDLKEALHKKGIDVEDNDFLIPLKRNKKQSWMPSYIPAKILPLMNENVLCYPITNESPLKNNHVVLKIKGNPIACIKTFANEVNNG